jgi:hypothetical protein
MACLKISPGISKFRYKLKILYKIKYKIINLKIKFNKISIFQKKIFYIMLFYIRKSESCNKKYSFTI